MRQKVVGERLWKRDKYKRWNAKLKRKEHLEWIEKKSQDSEWKFQWETRKAIQAEEEAIEDAADDSWLEFAYLGDGPTYDWVYALAD